MEIIKNYDTFKEKCTGFEEKIRNQYMQNNQIICHPTVENLIIIPCSAEEAKSNAINICRMADMLLMSEDVSSWQTFVIAEARKIADQNGYVFITDLCYESAFQSEDWMINGRNDTIVVSEEYMREKGKRYAPVTPLTNRVLPLKKIYNDFFWKQAPDQALYVLNKAVIVEELEKYSAENIRSFSNIKNCSKAVFKLFNQEIEIDEQIVRQNYIEKIFERVDNICDEMKKNAEVFTAVAYNFNIVDFICGMLVTYLQNVGIGITKDRFVKEYYLPLINDDIEETLERLSSRSNRPDIDCIKIAFIEAIEKESEFNFKYTAQNYDEYMQSLHSIETSEQDDYDVQFMLCELLRNKPLSPAVFNLILASYPNEVDNVEAIASFWNISDFSDYELRDYIFNEYIIKKNMLDENGEFAVELELARITKAQLDIVTKKYRCKDTDCLKMLNNYIDEMDKKQRTYNGTLFDNVDDMKKAMENEIKLRDLCSDLSALDKKELLALKKYIMELNADRINKAKYLVKVKLALNECEHNQLKLMCTDLLFMSLDDALALKEKVISLNFDEVVAKPYMIDINDRILAAQREELSLLFKDLLTKTKEELVKLESALKSGRYSSMFVRYYSGKIQQADDSIARNELDKLCADSSTLDRNGLMSLKSVIAGKDYRAQVKNRYLRKIDVLLSEFDKNEVAELFAEIESADKASLDSMKKIAQSGKYNSMLLAPYVSKIAAREKILLQEEFEVLCSNISSMNREELETLKKTVSNGVYENDLIEKCNEAVRIREYELTKAEIDNLCKNIASMSRSELDSLKDILFSTKYNDVLTAPYFDKISERENILILAELDAKCADISDMSMEQLVSLKEEIYDNQDYDCLCKPYIDKIDLRIDELKKVEEDKMVSDIETYTRQQLDAFINKINEDHEELGEELYTRCVEAIGKRIDGIEIEELEELCRGWEAFDMQKVNSVEAIIFEKHYKSTNSYEYIENLNKRIHELYTEQLERITDNIEKKSKEALLAIKDQIEQFDSNCPDEIKAVYADKVTKQIKAVADAELKAVCGNIDALTVKQSFDLIRKINTMSIEEQKKEEYIDLIDSHIFKLNNNECNLYLSHIIKKMAEYNITSVHFHVPTISKVFNSKYDSVCKTYVSSGRYELPLLIHESTVGNNDEGFTITTEYLYYKNKQGAFNRIKIEDISTFQAKKTLVSATLQVIEKNGTTTELPTSINKSIIDSASKLLSSLISYIHDERATASMQEIIESKPNESISFDNIKMPSAVKVDVVSNKTAEEEEKVPVAACAAEMWTLESDEVISDEEEETEDNLVKTEEELDDADLTEKEPVGSTIDEEVKEEATELQTEAPAEERRKIKFCEQCGAKITSETAKFCAECGHKLF